MARAEYLGLAGLAAGLAPGLERYFLGKEEEKQRALQEARQEESAYRQALSDLYLKQAVSGMLAKEEIIPAAPPPQIPLTLGQRLETGIAPTLLPEAPPVTTYKPLTLEEQTELFKSIYGRAEVPEGIKIRPPAVEEVPVYFVDPTTQEITSATGEVLTGAIPKGARLVTKPPIPESPEVIAERQIRRESAKKQLEGTRKLRGLSPIIDQVENLTLQPSLLVGKGVKGRLKGLGLGLQSITQIGKAGEEGAAYRAFSRGIRPQIVKAMGDVGNFSKTEQEAAERLIPNITDTDDVKRIKLRNLRTLINLKIQDAERQLREFGFVSLLNSRRIEPKEVGTYYNPVPTTQPQITQTYNIGDIITTPSGNRYEVKGFFEDGEPDVELVK